MNENTEHIEELRNSAKNRILNFPANVPEYNRAEERHDFLRDSAMLAQTEALLAISEELTLIRQHLQSSPVRTPSQPDQPASPPASVRGARVMSRRARMSPEE